MKKSFIITAVILFLLSAIPCWSITTQIDCTSSSTVQTAIGNATVGDTIQCNTAGSYDWNTRSVSCNGKTVAVCVNKGITLDGNGSTIAGQASGTFEGIVYVFPASGTGRITNFIFTGTGGVALVSGQTGKNARLDHCSFPDASGTVLSTEEWPFLVDHNTFTGSLGETIHNYGDWTNGSWTTDVTPGGSEMSFFEDNTITDTSASNQPSWIQSYYGARVVMRHNTVYNAGLDVHGNTPPKGRWWEVYENDIYISRNFAKPMGLRGGSGVIFNNRRHDLTGAAGSRGISLWSDDGSRTNMSVGCGRIIEAVCTNWPAHLWNNTIVGDGSWEGGGDGSVIVENVNYCLNDPSNACGTAVGWSYTAHTYPHPLSGGTPAGPIGFVISSAGATIR